MPTKPILLPAAARHLTRSRGNQRPMPVPGLAEAARVRDRDVKALEASLANKPLKPPGRKAEP